MDALQLMVNRTEPGVTEYPPLGEKECISVEDALQAMTLGGAYQMRLENRKGSLEKGKDADFAILTKILLKYRKTNYTPVKLPKPMSAANACLRKYKLRCGQTHGKRKK